MRHNKFNVCFFLLCFFSLCLISCGAGSGNPNAGAPNDGTGVANDAGDLADFPWPPPRPSATYNLPTRVFASCKVYNDVATKIITALDACGYNQRSIFHVPGGFAIAAQIEQINEDGSPKPENERWNVKYTKQKIFSLKDYVKALFTSSPGFYRCIVFIVTNKSFRTSPNEPSDSLVESFPVSGNNALPQNYGQTPVNNHSCMAFIYEIQKKDDGEATLLVPSTISGEAHLTKSNIYNKLSYEN